MIANISNLRLESVQSLSGFPGDSPAGSLFNSSDRRWKAPLTGAIVGLELVEITLGLHISNERGEEMLQNPGDVYTLGEGDTLYFTPLGLAPYTAGCRRKCGPMYGHVSGADHEGGCRECFGKELK